MTDSNTATSPPAKPAFDYVRWPYSPREGYQAEGNFRYLTASLFLETAPEDKYPLVRYCLTEHEVYVPVLGKWLPSARLIYTHAIDEYDAMRKLVGNPNHWERVLALPRIATLIDDWRAEQTHMQRLVIREALWATMATQPKSTVSAAKALLQMIDSKAYSKAKHRRGTKAAEPPSETAVEEDHNRVVSIANGLPVQK